MPNLLKKKETKQRELIEKLLKTRNILTNEKFLDKKRKMNVGEFKDGRSLGQVFIGKNASFFIIERHCYNPCGLPAHYQHLLVYYKETVQMIVNHDELDNNGDESLARYSEMKIKEILTDKPDDLKVKVEYKGSWGCGRVVEKIIDLKTKEIKNGSIPDVSNLSYYA